MVKSRPAKIKNSGALENVPIFRENQQKSTDFIHFSIDISPLDFQGFLPVDKDSIKLKCHRNVRANEKSD